MAETGTDLDAGVAFTTPLWLWEGDAAWHFVTLPEELSDAMSSGPRSATSSATSAPSASR